MNDSEKVPQPSSIPVTTNPYVGILAVFIGAGLATLNSRLLSVGLPDLRGALGLSFDGASWLPTALNMATMFSGVFIVFLNAFWGPRRILLPAAAIFMVVSMVLPFAPNYQTMLVLVVLAGISSGTFYSLTMTFVLTILPKRLIIFGIAAYAADIVFVSNFASLLEGWFMEGRAWQWIFWTAALFSPVMMVCVYYGIPRRPAADPKPSWEGFVYFSMGLALLYGAMDQGERLDWFNSATVVAMSAAGVFLLAAAVVRRLYEPNPVLNLKFLNTRNIIILALSIFVFKFMHLAAIVLVPGFLGNIQHYRPLETGHTLAWVALPMFVVVWLVATTIIYTNSRMVLAVGLTAGAVSCWLWSHVDTSWAGNSFQSVELLLACALACTYIGLVSSIVLEGLEAGALTSAANAATFSGFMHFIRIFGGQIGVTVLTRFISVREKFHSNMLGLHLQTGSWLTDNRLHMLTGAMLPYSTGPEVAQHRAVAILSQQVRAQAYTLATSDGFILIVWVVFAYLLLMLLLRPGKISFKDLRKMQ
ncbi:MFS transporter [Edaphobacter bradus]|uniref:MFS transporter n=1 Tax=Edaphobacter bradus TaxID=2259016 RepID=UPI0021DFA3A2|nr:MFS transporter [Edaphobacter bradus]